jgi:hypothetical protein
MKRKLALATLIAALLAIALWAANHLDLIGMFKRLHGG